MKIVLRVPPEMQQANDGEKKSQQARVEANETLVETAYKTWWGEIHLYTIARMAKAAGEPYRGLYYLRASSRDFAFPIAAGGSRVGKVIGS